METQNLKEKSEAYFLEGGGGGLISDEEEELIPFPRSYNTKYKVRLQISTFEPLDLIRVQSNYQNTITF